MFWLMVLSMQAAMAEEPVATLAGEAKPPEALMRALSVREGAPSCQDLQAMTETPVAHLGWVVSNVTMPPWAAMGFDGTLSVRRGKRKHETTRGGLQ